MESTSLQHDLFKEIKSRVLCNYRPWKVRPIWIYFQCQLCFKFFLLRSIQSASITSKSTKSQLFSRATGQLFNRAAGQVFNRAAYSFGFQPWFQFCYNVPFGARCLKFVVGNFVKESVNKLPAGLSPIIVRTFSFFTFFQLQIESNLFLSASYVLTTIGKFSRRKTMTLWSVGAYCIVVRVGRS